MHVYGIKYSCVKGTICRDRYRLTVVKWEKVIFKNLLACDIYYVFTFFRGIAKSLFCHMLLGQLSPKNLWNQLQEAFNIFWWMAGCFFGKPLTAFRLIVGHLKEGCKTYGHFAEGGQSPPDFCERVSKTPWWEHTQKGRHFNNCLTNYFCEKNWKFFTYNTLPI
jgi:hypothetical protein